MRAVGGKTGEFVLSWPHRAPLLEEGQYVSEISRPA
jgi:hypothetical protein